MRRRLLSQSGLDGIHDMVCYINRSVSQTPFKTIRVKFATTSAGVSNSNVFIDKNVTDGSTASPWITITSDDLVTNLTTLGLKRSDDFYYGLFFTESDMGIIIASNTETTPLQYKRQPISTLFTSGVSNNWYNQRVTMNAGLNGAISQGGLSVEIPQSGGSATVRIFSSYASYNYIPLTNTTDFSINKTTGGGSLTTTGISDYAITAKSANSTETKKSATFAISNGSYTLSDAIIDKQVEITQFEKMVGIYLKLNLNTMQGPKDLMFKIKDNKFDIRSPDGVTNNNGDKTNLTAKDYFKDDTFYINEDNYYVKIYDKGWLLDGQMFDCTSDANIGIDENYARTYLTFEIYGKGSNGSYTVHYNDVKVQIRRNYLPGGTLNITHDSFVSDGSKTFDPTKSLLILEYSDDY